MHTEGRYKKLRKTLGRVSRRSLFALGVVVAVIAGDTAAAFAQTTTTIYDPSGDISSFVGDSVGSIGPMFSSSGLWATLGALLVLFFAVAFVAKKIRGRWSVG